MEAEPANNPTQQTHTQRRRTTREIVKERDGWRCLVCGTSHALTVHHIRPKAIGGTYYHTNLATLCAPCHRELEEGAKHLVAQTSRRIESRIRRLITSLGPWIVYLFYGPRFWLHIQRKRVTEQFRPSLH